MALSTQVKSILGQLKQPEESQQKWRQKFFILAHGTFSTMIIGQLALGASFAITMASSPTMDEFFYATAFYAMLLIAAPYQRFWQRHRKNVAKTFQKLAEFAEKLERDATEKEEDYLRSRIASLRRILRLIYTLFAVQASLMVLSPINDIRLPWSLRGLPLYHPSKLALQAFQILVIGTIALSCLQLYIMQTAMVNCANAGFEVIAKRFRRVDTRRGKDVRNIVALHRELSEVVEDFVPLFEGSNSVLLFEMLIITLLGTLAGIMGVRSPEILAMVPICFSFIGLVCGLSNTLEVSSSKITEGVFTSRWTDADTLVRRTLLCVMVRSQRPAVLTATMFGRLTLPLMLKLLKDWYRCVQAMLNLNLS